MASILDVLNTEIGEQLLGKASNETSEKKESIAAALSTAMPLILSAMKRNAQKDDGAASLDRALNSDKHNGDLLQNLSDVDSSSLQNEGSKILDHIFGGKQSGINSTLSKTLNMDENSIASILKMAAPIILSILGSQKRKDNVSQGGLTDLIGSVLGNSASNDQSFLETILDRDGDGSVIDDIGGMILGGGNKKKDGGSILGGFTGGK